MKNSIQLIAIIGLFLSVACNKQVNTEEFEQSSLTYYAKTFVNPQDSFGIIHNAVIEDMADSLGPLSASDPDTLLFNYANDYLVNYHPSYVDSNLTLDSFQSELPLLDYVGEANQDTIIEILYDEGKLSDGVYDAIVQLLDDLDTAATLNSALSLAEAFEVEIDNMSLSSDLKNSHLASAAILYNSLDLWINAYLNEDTDYEVDYDIMVFGDPVAMAVADFYTHQVIWHSTYDYQTGLKIVITESLKAFLGL